MSTKKPAVLLIEDDPMISKMYETKFSMEGFTLETASDGETGLEKAKKLLPSILLLDIILPKLDGFAVLAELKKDPATARIPVMLLTNLGQDEDIKKGKSLGADDYFVKSNHTPADIVKAVQTMLRKK
ncbi:MAG: response regulator [Candidatus Kerfeldbacteria bacterium]|nr:response regulator [Candidatus Kerfeldbacteria bacterium]